MTLSETITRVGDISMWFWCLCLVKALKTNQALRVFTLLVLVVYCIHSQRVYNRQDICKRESQSCLLGERKSTEERDCHKEAPTHCLKISWYQTILPPNVVMIIHPPGIKPSTFLLPCQECPQGNEEQKSTTGWWRRHGWSPTDGEGGGRTQPLLLLQVGLGSTMSGDYKRIGIKVLLREIWQILSNFVVCIICLWSLCPWWWWPLSLLIPNKRLVKFLVEARYTPFSF